MPLIDINGTRINYEEHGSGPETIVFAHSLLCNLNMYKKQIAHFKDRYRCIAFDFRGQGKSAVPKDGYDMDTLAEDARALIQALDCAPCHFLGLSMGGFVGLRLASRYPELLRSLIIMDSSMDAEEKSKISKYKLLAFFANLFGMRPLAGQVIPILFGESFVKDPGNRPVIDQWKEGLFAASKKGVINAVHGVINRKGLSEEAVRSIGLPTLIMVGEADVATPVSKSRRIHELISGSAFKIIPKAGHLSNLEDPVLVNGRLDLFFSNGS